MLTVAWPKGWVGGDCSVVCGLAAGRIVPDVEAAETLQITAEDRRALAPIDRRVLGAGDERLRNAYAAAAVRNRSARVSPVLWRLPDVCFGDLIDGRHGSGRCSTDR